MSDDRGIGPRRRKGRKMPTTKKAPVMPKGAQAEAAAALAKKRSLRQHLLAEAKPHGKPEAAKNLIKRALAKDGWTKKDDGWSHPTKKGSTPDATASTAILSLQRDGLLDKPERGMVCRSMDTARIKKAQS
jgi:hypothetical protein